MRKNLDVAVALLLLASTASIAAEGRIPIFGAIKLDVADGEPIGGKYFVTRNIFLGGGRVIDIIGSGAEDIEIDLNGFTLRTGTASVIHADGLRTLIIRNGICQHLGATVNIRVRNTERLIIEGVNATGGQHGIFVDVGTRAFIVRNNTITDVVENGILASPTSSEGATEIGDGVIESNLILSPDGRGIEARFGFLSLAIVGNRVDDAGTYGITANSTGAITIADNKVNGANYRGLIANRTTSCRVSGNVVKNAGRMMDTAGGGDGIDIADAARNCLVLNNVSTGNWAAGIRVRGKANHIDRNVVNDNGLAGLHFTSVGTLNTFGRNTARANGTRLIAVGNCVSNPAGNPSLATPEFCDESAVPTSNSSFGDNLAPGPPPG